MTNWKNWQSRLESAIYACERIGGKSTFLSIKPPASKDSVRLVESSLGETLPKSFRDVLLQYSGEMSFYWFLPEEKIFPSPFQNIFRGDCSWNIDSLIQLDQIRRGWIEKCFPDAQNPYDSVWHNAFTFLEVGNGDSLAIDLKSSNDGPVVYLSHDGSDSHGYLLGENFIDFIDRWSQIGCPGSEDWQILPFTKSKTSFIDPSGSEAKLWRRLFGLR